MALLLEAKCEFVFPCICITGNFIFQRTRAEVLIERACVRRQGTSDVLENARLWNVPVWPLSKLLKWVTVLKENNRYRPQKAQGTVPSKNSLSSAPKVQRLKTPYIKTECFNRLVGMTLLFLIYIILTILLSFHHPTSDVC